MASNDSNPMMVTDDERCIIMLLRQNSNSYRQRLLKHLIEQYVMSNDQETELQQAIKASMESKQQEDDHAIALQLQQEEKDQLSQHQHQQVQSTHFTLKIHQTSKTSYYFMK